MGAVAAAHQQVGELVREDVAARVARVAVEVKQVLLAARGLQPAHAACALVERDALLARVPAVHTLHVTVLGQVARALVLADDVHARSALR